MKTLALVTRNRKEILRDPISLVFFIGVPLVMLIILSVMQKNMPYNLFEIEKLAPGMAVFSFSFISLFSGMLIAKDRSSWFLTRLFASPLSSSDFIIGYSLPLLAIALLQSAVCFITAFFFGLSIDINVLLTILILIPSAILFIGLGLLLGCVFNDKQVGGIASMVIMLVSFLGGIWYNLDMMGETLKTISNVLPFVHSVKLTQTVLNGSYSEMNSHIIWVLAYTVIVFATAILVFKKKMDSDNI